MRSVFSVFLVLVLGVFAFGQTGTTPPGTVPDPAATATKKDDPKVTASPAPQDAYQFPDGKTRAKRYFKSLFGWTTLGRHVGLAGFNTWRNSPEEWGDTWEGFGRRVASNFGRNTIRQSTQYGLDEVLKLDSYYYRSKKKDVRSKVGNAVISTFTARNREGKRVVGIPRLTATYTSAIVSYEAWYPDRYDWKDGLKTGTIGLGFNVGWNLVKEFIWK